ncbi:MAG: type II secretion system major pseudopilin GspG [Planctomycetota bacterium]|nr:type II secretion system major pseudopilin GspG [Planctomycetota bacterium]
MRNKERKRTVRYGFTMLELMAVLIIIGLLATLVVTKVASKIDQARVTTTMANLKILHSSVNQFKMDTSRFPAEEEGLMALIEQPSDVSNWEPGGYLETTQIPKDGWGNDFIYELYPESGKPFVIKSLGADGEEGGEGYNTDLLSTDAYVEKKPTATTP